jgi:hypothetical protein
VAGLVVSDEAYVPDLHSRTIDVGYVGELQEIETVVKRVCQGNMRLYMYRYMEIWKWAQPSPCSLRRHVQACFVALTSRAGAKWREGVGGNGDHAPMSK